ncbi:MAG: Holliday junction resolvase RuvX [Deltaproteobacteria bacterium]|nr:Holliday junction resolvase RuvX [Deltaproteobacteria bacterium]
MRALGLDLGTKTIGVAASDELGLTAQPVKTIRRSSIAKDIEEILKTASERSIDIIVAGMPINMDGTHGERSKAVALFVKRLKEKTGIPVTAWDERLSTAAVTRALIEGDISRRKRKEVVDKLAAAYILQGYMDSRRHDGGKFPD